MLKLQAVVLHPPCFRWIQCANMFFLVTLLTLLTLLTTLSVSQNNVDKIIFEGLLKARIL